MTNRPMELQIRSDSAESTLRIGRALGRVAQPGLTVGLIGPLGAGKTLLVRGIAEGLEVPDSRIVSSPTFVLIQEYSGRLPIYHFDTYRLSNPQQFAELGIHEYFEGAGVCLIEWSDRVSQFLPDDRMEIAISIAGPDTRAFRFSAPIPSRAGDILNQLGADEGIGARRWAAGAEL